MSDRVRALVLIVMGILMVVVGPPAMLADGKRKADKVAALRQGGRKVTAQVTAVKQNIRRTDKLTYAFEADGRRVDVTEEASREATDRAESTGKVDAIYLPSDPEVATIDLERLDRSSRALTSWAPWAIAGGGLLILGIGVWRLKRSQ